MVTFWWIASSLLLCVVTNSRSMFKLFTVSLIVSIICNLVLELGNLAGTIPFLIY